MAKYIQEQTMSESMNVGSWLAVAAARVRGDDHRLPCDPEHPSVDVNQILLCGADIDEQRQRASGDERCCPRLAHSTVNSGYSVD